MRDGRSYVDEIEVRTVAKVADVSLDIGSHNVPMADDPRMHTVPFATTWTNRKCALVHDYFRVLGDGTHDFLGTYCD